MRHSIRASYIALALLALGPAQAFAGAAGVQPRPEGGKVLTYFGSHGSDWVYVSRRDEDTIEVSESEGVSPGPGCRESFSGDALCDAEGVTHVVGHLGAGSDRASFSVWEPLVVWADGGPGDDRLEDHGTVATFEGGAGDDWLATPSVWAGNLRGGPGDDVLQGGLANDRFEGGTGRDLVWYGRDSIDENFETVEISLDGKGPDGVPGEQDRISRDIEGASSDIDSIQTGNAGRNLLRGGEFEDVLTGRGGRDILIGGAGGDWLYAHDGRADTVACGPDLDVAYVDRRDDVSAECEIVRMRRPGR